MRTALEVFSDLSERIRYNLPDFPVYVRRGVLSHFEGYSAECHWHPDLEFLLILGGQLSYFINGQVVEVRAGEGLFVNSQRLHYGFSLQGKDCQFLVVSFHPYLLVGGSAALSAALAEKFGPETEDFVKLSPSVEWQKLLLEDLQRLELAISLTPPPILGIVSKLVVLMNGIGDHLSVRVDRSSLDNTWMTVWKMRSFIQQNYGAELSLEDIATAGAVCRSRCCQLFAQHLGESPTQFLNHYRISRASEMLRDTGRTMSEIALACGFRSPSYFSSVFRAQVGMAPREYRGGQRP